MFVPRLLIFEPTYLRLKDQIDAVPDVTPVLVSADGKISDGGRQIEPEAAAPDAAWLNNDLFESGASREYMAAVLKAPKLVWLQSAAAGFDHPIFGELAGKGVRLTTSHGQAVGIAEYVVWGVLDHFQRGPARRAEQARKSWERHGFREIMGSSWLIIGFGAIGQGVAERVRAFGAHVTGVRRSIGPHPLADRIAAQADLPALLPQADVVVLCAPLSAGTRHIADAAFFSAMKARSVLVNVGRGALVDEAALLAALEGGIPEHAVLDVFETEPLPPDSPFWDHPRVTLTPHASAITPGMGARNDVLFLDNLARFAAGQPLLNEASRREVLGE
jgi:phosphoglycerate dehydrogenase-like enzyme